MTDETVRRERIEQLIEQVEDQDSETLFETLAVLADDIDRTVERDISFASPEFQSVYDDVRTDERVIRDATAEDFRLTEAVDEYEHESVSLALVRGGMDFEDVLSRTERADLDVSGWTRSGEKLYRRFAAKFRNNVCNDPSVGGSLDRSELIAAITLIVTTLLTGSIYLPLAVIIATLIVKSGLDTYCPDRRP